MYSPEIRKVHYNKAMKIFITVSLGVLAVVYAAAWYVIPRSSIVVAQPAAITASIEQTQPPVPPTTTILALGDLMLDRAVRTKIESEGPMYPFEKMQPLLAGNDITVANAEGVFTDNKSISVVSTSTLLFTFSTSTLPILKQLGFTLFSQANNHALNFGWKGITASKTNIAAAGMQAFGDPDNIDPGPQYEVVGNEMLAFVGYDQFSADGGNSSSTLSSISAAKAAKAFVLVYPHWGVEYNDGTTSLQTLLAHKFVDAGADVVLGSHPHVIEPIEIYKGKAIFYSMGNFVFDQPWSDTKEGLAIKLTLSSTTESFTLVPLGVAAMQPQPMEGALRTAVLLGLSSSAVASDEIKTSIKEGGFILSR
jgi:poly-gamma-glutamate synthesis protein (capsule biosynthesis protein)